MVERMKDSKLFAGDVLLALMRIAVGWHFLYEGCWKLLQPEGWSCVSYLNVAQGPLAPVFSWMAGQAWLVSAGDWAVMLGLVAIGLGLITGVLARYAALAGILLMALFYCCQPPEPFAHAVSGADGRFFVVERNVIEAFALLLIAAWPCWKGWVKTFLPGCAVLFGFGGLVYGQYRNGAFRKVEAVTSATVKVHEFTALKALKAPFAETNELVGCSISALALGGDLIAGHSHARDLIWTDEFMRRYHTGGTLERTVRYSVFCGLSAAFVEPGAIERMAAAAKSVGGELAFFSNCANGEDAALAVKNGARSVYLRPEVADARARSGDGAGLTALLAALRQTGLPVGLGAESLETVKFAVEKGIVPDYWVVAFHSLDYPAATLKVAHNSIWCRDPEATAAYLKTRPEPWVAIRGLAGGAIKPEDAYRFARKHGAVVVAVDLLDYRIVETVNALVPAKKEVAK